MCALPRKAVPDMTYYVLSRMLKLTYSLSDARPTDLKHASSMF